MSWCILLANLHAYGFSIAELRLIYSYLTLLFPFALSLPIENKGIKKQKVENKRKLVIQSLERNFVWRKDPF